MPTDAAPVLRVDRLSVSLSAALCRRALSYALTPGRTLGVVGESGCGKSMTALALMGLVPSPGQVTRLGRLEGAN